MRSDREYASFIIHDWRNKNVAEVSSGPGHTANYFNGEGNSLPYELSPAFFRPEVLSKYKADRDKYTIDEAHRFISCRGTWELWSFDVNEAGQVHAYLCDLRYLPHQEQLHWKSYDERPKGTISKRSLENDFQGVWASYETPLERVLYTVSKWARHKPGWWQIQAEDPLLRVNTPISENKDGWGLAFVDLSKYQRQHQPFRPPGDGQQWPYRERPPESGAPSARYRSADPRKIPRDGNTSRRTRFAHPGCLRCSTGRRPR